MFIASYATYVPTIPTTKTDSLKEKDYAPKVDTFVDKEPIPTETKKSQESYKTIASYHRYSQEKSKNLDLYEKVKTVHDAQRAYSEIMQPFSMMKKPKAPQQSSFLTLNLTLPKEAKNAQEILLKTKMVNGKTMLN